MIHSARAGADLPAIRLIIDRVAEDFVRVDVARVPAAARHWRDVVCIDVDELRASSTILTLLERGVGAIVPAANAAEARRIAVGNGHILAGERNVVRPPGFDFGNSLTEIDGADLRDHDVVLSTAQWDGRPPGLARRSRGRHRLS
jgi:2-phosphosulpholactate phosphatase